MEEEKTFVDGTNQNTLPPREFHAHSKDMFDNQIGVNVLQRKKESKWDTLLSSLEMFTDDFLSESGEPLGRVEK